MTKYQNLSSNSGMVTLDVSDYVTLGSISMPAIDPKVSGASFSVSFNAVVVDGSGTVTFTIRKNGSVVNSKVVTAPGIGQTISDSFSNMSITADSTFLVTAVNAAGTATGGTGGTRVVELLVQLATTLTLGLNPSSAKPGNTVTASGNLKRTASGMVISNAPIRLFNVTPGNILVNTGTTDLSGNYSITFPAGLEGSYTYRAEFISDNAFLASSISDEVGLHLDGDVGGILPLLIAGGVLLLLAGGKKKRRR